MFTAMTRRPIVWLLATLALLGAGWAAYGPLRQALEPGAPERSPEAGPAAVTEAPAGPPPAAGEAAKAVAEPPAPAPPPAAAVPETARAGPVEPAPAAAAAGRDAARTAGGRFGAVRGSAAAGAGRGRCRAE